MRLETAKAGPELFFSSSACKPVPVQQSACTRISRGIDSSAFHDCAVHMLSSGRPWAAPYVVLFFAVWVCSEAAVPVHRAWTHLLNVTGHTASPSQTPTTFAPDFHPFAADLTLVVTRCHERMDWLSHFIDDIQPGPHACTPRCNAHKR